MFSKLIICTTLNLMFQMSLVQALPLEHSNLFQLKTSPLFGPTRIGLGWPASSLIMCAKACLETYQGRCLSFMYNPSTLLCTPGATMNSTEPQPSSEEGELYLLSLPCEESLGFYVYSQNQTNLCLGVSAQQLNYTFAHLECQSRGGFLMSLKDLDTVAIMGRYIDSQFSEGWVGCDDIETEGVFLWKEDGSKVTNDWVFNDYEPNNAGNEDCCQYIAGPDGLNDNKCDYEMSFICQKMYQ